MSDTGIGQIIGKFKRLSTTERLSTTRLDTLTRQRGAEVVFFCDFRERGCAPFAEITLAERRRRELIADEGGLHDSDLIFSNNMSYTQGIGKLSRSSKIRLVRYFLQSSVVYPGHRTNEWGKPKEALQTGEEESKQPAQGAAPVVEGLTE